MLSSECPERNLRMKFEKFRKGKIKSIMQSFLDFFQSSNLLNYHPEFSNQFILGELIFFCLLLILAFASKIYFKPRFSQSELYKTLSDKVFTVLITCTMCGFMLIFFQWQIIPYLSAPFLLILLIIVLIVWLISIARYYFQDFKKSLSREKEKHNYEKYLPKNKG